MTPVARNCRHWVIVAGGIDTHGAMDKANLALALHLARIGRSVEIVAHRTTDVLLNFPNVRVHNVAWPLNSDLLGQWNLNHAGRKIAREIVDSSIAPIVVSNGGNCVWPGLNWVHSVHHEWPPADAGAPPWFKIKNRLAKAAARRRERLAFSAATILVANSDRTKNDLVRHFPQTEGKAVRIYLGSDPEISETTPMARKDARESLGIPLDLPVLLFVGALSHDNNKGLDTLIEAWRALSNEGGWNCSLLIAGGGNGLQALRNRLANDPGIGKSITVMGYRDDLHSLYMAADLVVAPSRYEAYGYACHEAICTGLSALVSRGSGIAERYPPNLHRMLLIRSTDVSELVLRLRDWRANVETWRHQFRAFGTTLRSFTWDDMAAQLVDIAESRV